MEENTNQSQASETNAWKYGFFVLAAVLIVGAIYVFMSNGSGVTGNVIANPGAGNQAPSNVKVDITGHPILGNKDAKVTIVEFTDFQCPFCRKAYNEALTQVVNEYVKTGKANMVDIQFPLSQIHPAAEASAEAALCVFHQYGNDAYWKYRDAVFTKQNVMDSGSPTGAVTKTVTYGPTELKSWAKELNYDISDCLDKATYAGEVQKDLATGQAAGVQGTPAFVINGVFVSGAQPFANFKSVIDSKLSA